MQNDKRKPRKITIERISVTTIRRSTSGGRKLFCNVCGSEVDTIVIPGDVRHPGECLIDAETIQSEKEKTTKRLSSPANEIKKTGEEK